MMSIPNASPHGPRPNLRGPPRLAPHSVSTGRPGNAENLSKWSAFYSVQSGCVCGNLPKNFYLMENSSTGHVTATSFARTAAGMCVPSGCVCDPIPQTQHTTRLSQTCRFFLRSRAAFCAGVTRAIAIVERALAIYGAPIYVTPRDRAQPHGRRTACAPAAPSSSISLADVPEGATVVFSAHGVPRAGAREAEERGLPRLRRHLSPRH